MPNQDYSPPLWMGGCIGNAELSEAECLDLCSMYSEPERFRSRIEMARYRFGNGEYQYFKYPLPDTVAELREELYRHLAPVATDWMEALELRTRFTGELTSFLEECHSHTQTRPTPLLLRYQTATLTACIRTFTARLCFHSG